MFLTQIRELYISVYKLHLRNGFKEFIDNDYHSDKISKKTILVISIVTYNATIDK